MKGSIDRDIAINALNLVRNAIPNKATNPILKTIFIEAKDEMFTFRATNNILDISVIVPGNVKKEGLCCVDSLLINLMPNFGEGDVEFSLAKKLTIKQGKSRHHIVYMDADKYPDKREIKDYTEYDPGELIKAFSLTSVSLRDLPDKEYLQGFHINPHLSYMITGDGHRVSLWEGLEAPGNITAPKGKTIMPLLSHIKDGDIFEVSFGRWSGFRVSKYAKDDTILMQSEMVFISLEGEFPQGMREQLLEGKETEPQLSLLVEKDNLKSILEICRLYHDRAVSEGRTAPVTLSKRNKNVFLSMDIQGLVDMKEPLKCKAKGADEFEILFSSKLLLDAVSKAEGELELKFFAQNKPFVMLDNEIPNYIYYQALMAMPKKIQAKEEDDANGN